MKQHPEIRLLVFDLDHTALGGHEPYNRFPPHFCAFLDGLSHRGVAWATNSTWSCEMQLELLRNGNLRSRPTFLGGASGRQLATVSGECLHMDREHSARIQGWDHGFRREHGKWIRSIVGNLLSRNLLLRVSLDADFQNCLRFASQRGKSREVRDRLQPLLERGVYAPWHPARFTQNTLLPFFMHKGVLLAAMQSRLSVGPANTLVAGDGQNDRPMFDPALAAYGVCPGNAHPGVKRAVRRLGGVVSALPYSWGVVDAVHRLLGRVPPA